MSRRSRSVAWLFASWIAWWLILVAWKLGSAVPAIMRVSQEGAKGSASANYGDGGFSATITEAGKTIWEGRISLVSLVLLVGIPPLVLWGIWLRSHRPGDSPGLIDAGDADHIALEKAEHARNDR